MKAGKICIVLNNNTSFLISLNLLKWKLSMKNEIDAIYVFGGIAGRKF